MRKILQLTALAFILPAMTMAQESFTKEIGKFDRIVVSPHINVVLTHGNSEEVTIEYAHVDPSVVNVDVDGSTLQLYLDEARYVPKTKKVDYNYRQDIYRDAEITAYVTYSYLSSLEVRGDQRVVCESPVDAVRFKLKTYGSNEIEIASLDAESLKVVSYGECELKIRSGKVSEQKFVLYGTSHVDVAKMTSEYSKAKIYGESELVLHASDELDVSAFGEPTITYYGNPMLHKNIIIGEARLFKVN